MRKGLVFLGVAAAAVLLATSASADNRGASFTPVGFIDEPGQYPFSCVMASSPDGTQFLVSPSFRYVYASKWTREGGWGENVGAYASTFPAIASDGTIMANGLYPGSDPGYGWPGIWMGETDLFDPLPPQDGYEACGNGRMSFHGLSSNGDYATGLTYFGCGNVRAFRWDRATDTTIELGTPNGRSTRGNAISDDGSKVAGFGLLKFGLRRGATWTDGEWTWVDGQGNIGPKACISTGSECTSNGDCPEFVDDASCPPSSKGTCQAGVCVGGFDAGLNCTNSSQCRGTCSGGPNNGLACTSNGACPDTPACVANPNWSDDAFKGEAYDITPDGRYVTGRNFGWAEPEWWSGYRVNPDGTITEIPVFEEFPDLLIEPYAVSDDGQVVVGFAGRVVTGFRPFFWSEATGIVDVQLFLYFQGYEDMLFWNLLRAHSVSADGTVLGGEGVNPNGQIEGFVVDMKKVWVCHGPSNDASKARTLGVSFDSIGDHLGHGDFLGTCKFIASGAAARGVELRQQWLTEQPVELLRDRTGSSGDFGGWEPDLTTPAGRHAIATPAGKQTRRER